jgi:hypothetical protein
MLLRAGAASFFFLTASAMSASAGDCGREAFAAVVGEAGAALTAMNEAHKQGFQAKLSALRSRNGWSDGDYAVKAAPFVRDDRIAAFDAKIQTLLAKVPELGAAAPEVAALAGAMPGVTESPSKRCEMLDKLRGLMAELIENNRAKWAYMTGKIDGALEEARQAQAASR